MKLSGYESSVLAFLAQRPESLALFRDKLGLDAVAIADYLAGNQSARQDIQETGDAIISWAKGCQERQRLESESGF